jgi:hypothetical protein
MIRNVCGDPRYLQGSVGKWLFAYTTRLFRSMTDKFAISRKEEKGVSGLFFVSDFKM